MGKKCYSPSCGYFDFHFPDCEEREDRFEFTGQAIFLFFPPRPMRLPGGFFLLRLVTSAESPAEPLARLYAAAVWA